MNKSKYVDDILTQICIIYDYDCNKEYSLSLIHSYPDLEDDIQNEEDPYDIALNVLDYHGEEY